MTDYYDAQGNLVETDSDEGRMAQLPRKVVRRLEKEAKEAETLRAENEQLKREREFVKAGIPLEDKRAAYFIAGYNGEQTSEAIRTEWNESFGSGSGSAQGFDQELRQQQDAQALVMGSGSAPQDALAMRNAELAGLSQTDPTYPQKFSAIMAKYDSVLR